MKVKSLAKARSLYRRKKYNELIRHLQPQVFMYRESLEYFQLIGSACFFSGDYGGSMSYVRRAIDIDEDNIEARLFLAAVYLKRRESDKAIQEWLAILDRQPTNRFAQKGLHFVRTLHSMDELRERVTQKQLVKFVPKVFNPLPLLSTLLVAALLVIGIIQLDPVQLTTNGLHSFFTKTPDRPGIEHINFPQGQPLTSLEGDYSEVLNEDEIDTILDRIRENFNRRKDNLVQIDINRILRSTATAPVKERVRSLAASLEAPDFTNMQTSYDYQEIVSDPGLYQNAFVRWKGRPSNIQQTENSVSFTLLVGYHTGQVLEGSVPVTVPFAARVRPDMGVELIGKIHLTPNQNSGSAFFLEAQAIRMFNLDQ